MEEFSPQKTFALTELKNKSQCVHFLSIDMAIRGKNTCISINR